MPRETGQSNPRPSEAAPPPAFALLAWAREAINLLWLYRDGFLPDNVASVFLAKTLWYPELSGIRSVNPNAIPPRPVRPLQELAGDELPEPEARARIEEV